VLALEGDQTLHLSYYAGSFIGDPAAQLRRSRATDGRTFEPTRYVYDPLTLETSRSAAQWAGDYMGVAAAGRDVFLAFTDNASTKPHVSFYRSPSALAADPMDPVLVPDAGAPDLGCYSNAPFTPNLWAPPSAFGQARCSAAQLAAYSAASTPNDYAAFRADPTNAACLGCLETDAAAPLHGPVVTQALPDGGRDILDFNNGGCQAHFDGMGDAGSCGEQANDSNDCVYFACASCSDLNNPSYGGPTYNCYYYAMSAGICGQHREITGCFLETLDGGAAQCGSFDTYAALWCGS
jgi:hypothetical protein